MNVNALHVGLAVSGEDLENVLSLSPNAKDRVSHPTSLDDSMEVDLSFDIHSLLGSSSPGNSPSIHTCIHTYRNSYIIHTYIHTYTQQTLRKTRPRMAIIISYKQFSSNATGDSNATMDLYCNPSRSGC